MAGVLIQMKLAVLRRSMTGQRAASMIAGGAIGLALAIGTLLLAFGHFQNEDAAVAFLALVMLVWAIGWLFGPMLTGGDATLRLEYFSLVSIRPRQLATGLFAAGFIGIPPVVGLVACAILPAYGARLGLYAGLIGIPAALLMLLFLVLLSKVGIQALGRLTQSRLGWELSSLVVGFVLGAQNTGWMDIPLLVRVLSGKWAAQAGTALKILPSSWPVLAVDAAARSQWGRVAETLGGLAVVCAALFVAYALLLGRHLVRGTASGRTAVRAPSGPGLVDRVAPDTRFGAVFGKELRMWGRDLRRARFLSMALWGGVFTGVLPLLDGHVVILPFVGITTALFAGALASNVYGLDAGALWLTLVTPAAERVDVRARQLAFALVVGVPTLLLTVVLIPVSGQNWAWPWLLAALPALVGASSGLVPLVSLIGVAPFADRPGGSPMDGFTDESSDQVRVKIFGMLFGQILLAAPALALVLAGTLTHRTALSVAGVLVGVATGVGLGWLFGWLARRRLEKAGPEILDLMRKGVRGPVTDAPTEAEEAAGAMPSRVAQEMSGARTALVALLVMCGILFTIPQGLVALILTVLNAKVPGWFVAAHVPHAFGPLVALASVVVGACAWTGVVTINLAHNRRQRELAHSPDGLERRDGDLDDEGVTASR